MALPHVDICGKDFGTIWTRRPTPSAKDGLMLVISNTKTGLTSQGRHMLFTKIAFGIGLHGNWFVAGDQLGNIYKFDITGNRFKLVLRAGQACTALACCISRPSEVLVALSDYSLKCVDIENSEVIANLRGHEASVHSISLHSSGRFALAVSTRDCVLWNTDSFTRCRTLNGGQDVGVQDVFFVPMTNIILSCFKDDSIHAWESETLDYKYQIPPPFGPTPRYRTFTVPRDGHLLVGGGRSNFLHVWTIENRQLLRVIQLPSKVRFVKQLIFLPNKFDGGSSESLGFLAQDGIMRFININSCKMLFQIGSKEQVLASVQACPLGRYIVAVSEAGNVMIYDVATLTQGFFQPHPSLIRLMEEEEGKEKGYILPTDVQLSRVVSSTRKQSTKSVSPKVPSLVPGKNRSANKSRRRKKLEKEMCNPSLDREKLLFILKGYGEYPTKYRMFIWRYLLGLPENHAAYSSLLEKGTHPAYLMLHQTYPIKSRKLLRVLQRALSVLAHWSAIFGETEYLPGLVFPFVKMFQNNQLVIFEMLATILLNWCGDWYEYFPNPPLNILAIIENLLAHHDTYLLQHFIKHNISSQLYAWPLLMTLFSEVLSKGEWLRVWDNVISHHPGYLLLMVVAYLTTARHTLLQCSYDDDFEFFFHHQSSVDIGWVICEANLLQQTTPPDIHPEKLLDPFVPLCKGTYPVFNKYPKFIVDYQIKERDRIRQDELEYLRKRQSALELERMTEKRKEEEEAWYRQQKLLMDAENQRRKIIEAEDQKLTDQRTRLQALKRELKVKELHVLDAAKRRFLSHQQSVREAELKRMDQEIKKKVVLRSKETEAVLDDLETRTVELERQKALLQQELSRCQEEMRYRLRADTDTDQHSNEVKKSILEHAVEEEVERERERLDKAHETLARTQAQLTSDAVIEEAKARRAFMGAKENVKMEELAEKAQLNGLREKQIQVLLQGLGTEYKANAMLDSHLAAATSEGGNSIIRADVESVVNQRDNTPIDTTLTSTVITNKDRTTSSCGVTIPSHDSSFLPADQSYLAEKELEWTHKRALLDQQESVMLSRIRELRKKVADQMHSTSNSKTATPRHY